MSECPGPTTKLEPHLREQVHEREGAKCGRQRARCCVGNVGHLQYRPQGSSADSSQVALYPQHVRRLQGLPGHLSMHPESFKD